MKYRATININKDIWDKFRAKCEAAGTTATAELTAFMELINDDREYDYDRLNNDWESLPETVRTIVDFIWGKLEITLDETIESRFKKGFADLSDRFRDATNEPHNIDIAKIKSLKIDRDTSTNDEANRSTNGETNRSTDSGTTEDTNKLTEPREPNDNELANFLAHDPVEQAIAAAVSKKSDDESENFPPLYVGDREITEVNQIKKILKFERAKASDNLRTYGDREVAAQSNLSPKTIQNYRVGRRSPKKEFYQTWGLNWSGTGWVKLT